LNEGKQLANQTLQRKIAEKQAKNKTKLNLHLSSLNLTNGEKKQFFENLNKKVNLNTIKSKASSYAAQKKRARIAKNAENLAKFMTEQGLTQNEQAPFINRILTNKNDLPALKKEVTTLMNSKLKSIRQARRQELVSYLNTLTLNKSNVDGILKNYDNTNINADVLKSRASGISEARRQELYARNEGEFLNYLNTLQELTPNNRTEITSKLDGFFTNWQAIKKKATNLAVQRGNERRQANRDELSVYMSKLGVNDNVKRGLLKNFDDKLKNMSTIKREASAIKNQMVRNKIAANRKVFSNFLGTLNLGKNDVNKILETFNNGTVNTQQLKQQAINLQEQRKKERRQELSVYVTELGLDESDKKLILSNYNANPRNIAGLKTKANELKTQRNKEEKEKIRQELKSYLNTLNLLNNKNKKTLLSNTTKSPEAIKTQAKQLQEFKKTVKRESNKSTLQKSIRNLSEQDQKYLLNKFNTRNVTLNSLLNEAKQIRQKRVEEKRVKDRGSLYNHLTSLNLNVADRNSILNKFNKAGSNVNSLKNEATKLKKQRVVEKKRTNKQSLVEFLDTLNLSGENKKGILDRFNANGNATLETLRTNAKKLVDQRKVEKRLSNRGQLIEYLAKIGLNNTDSKTIVNKFNADESIRILDLRKEAVQIMNQRIKEKTAQNRDNLVNFLNNLSLPSNDIAKILKNFDSKAATLNNLKSRATNINSKIKTKISERKELSSYINTLGINGTKLLKKLDDGRSTLNRLKEDAKKMREVANAQIVRSKKDELRKYMAATKLTNVNKQSFVNRINLNTNLDIIKREVRELNSVLKGKNEEVARKKSELSVFLNDLNNLTPKQRTQFIKQVVSANTNIQPIKNQAASVNRTVKNRKIEQQRLENQKKRDEQIKIKKRDQERLEKHLSGLKYITNEEKSRYMSNFTNNKATLKNIVDASKAKNKNIENRKTKRLDNVKTPLLNRIRDAVPGFFGQWRREWESEIRKANSLEELESIAKRINEKIQLRKNIMNANIDEGRKKAQLRFVMKKNDSVEKRREELARNIRNKKNRMEKELAKTKPTTSVAFEPNNSTFTATNNPLFNEPKRPTLKNVGKRVVQNVKVKRMTNTLKKAANMEKRREEVSKLQGAERVAASRKLAANEGRNRGKTGENIKVLFNKKASAIKEIRAFKGAGIKNQNRFVRRLNAGENVNKVLKEARARNALGLKQMSKTKKALMKAQKN
jgi:hypothetical protein